MCQCICYHAVQRTGLWRRGSIHVLRRSFATHPLEAGVEIAVLLRLLGHAHLNTTPPTCTCSRNASRRSLGRSSCWTSPDYHPPCDAVPFAVADAAFVPRRSQGGDAEVSSPPMETAPRAGYLQADRTGRADVLLSVMPPSTTATSNTSFPVDTRAPTLLICSRLHPVALSARSFT
jgi:hypothetical protein